MGCANILCYIYGIRLPMAVVDVGMQICYGRHVQVPLVRCSWDICLCRQMFSMGQCRRLRWQGVGKFWLYWRNILQSSHSTIDTIREVQTAYFWKTSTIYRYERVCRV